MSIKVINQPLRLLLKPVVMLLFTYHMASLSEYPISMLKMIKIYSKLNSVGAKSQILSSVAPPGRKTWPLFSVRGMSWGLGNPCFTKFSVVNFL